MFRGQRLCAQANLTLTAPTEKILLNDIRLDTGVLTRGHKLTKEDILYLKMAGVKNHRGRKPALPTFPPKMPFPTWRRVSAAETSFIPLPNATCAKLPPNGTASSFVRKIASPNLTACRNGLPPTRFRRIRMSAKAISLPFCRFFRRRWKKTCWKKSIFKLSGNQPLLNVEEARTEQAAVIYTKIL